MIVLIDNYDSFTYNLAQMLERMDIEVKIYRNDQTDIRRIEALRPSALMVAKDSLPACLEISAWTAEGEIMGLRHHKYRVEGVQFHPESILTESGPRLLQNFLNQRRIVS